MTETQIVCFLTAAESKSFTEASEKLFRSVQSLNKNIANLEQELNCILFERNFQGVSLTSMGKEYYAFFKASKVQFKHTLNTIKYMYEGMRSHFCVGISTWIDPFGKIYEALTEFKEMNPDTSFELLHQSNDELFSGMKNNEIDISIMCDSQIFDRAENFIETFANEDLCLFISNTLLEKERDAYILYDASYGPWSSQQWNFTSERLLNRHIHYDIQMVQHMPNLKSTVVNVENQGGMAVCDSNFGYLTESTPEMTRVPIQMESSLACVWNKHNEHPLIPEFTAFLKSFYEGC